MVAAGPAGLVTLERLRLQQPGDVHLGDAHRGRRRAVIWDAKDKLCAAREELGVLSAEGWIGDLCDRAAIEIAEGRLRNHLPPVDWIRRRWWRAVW
jgi:hypothetical protein